jgi:hypothetical protein
VATVDELLDPLLQIASSICVSWAIVLVLVAGAFVLCYKALRQGIPRPWNLAAFASLPVAVALMVWFLLRVANSIFQGCGFSL